MSEPYDWAIVDGLFSPQHAATEDAAYIVPPIIGSSAVLVRSDKSWHAVSRVAPGCMQSRRGITVTSYRDRAISTMWPPGDNTPTFDYTEAEAF